MNESRQGNSNFVISQMSRQEVEKAIQWAQAESWNPGLRDAECFYNTDPTGFYAAKIGKKIVATVSVVKYSDDFAFAGFYIVRPDLRGKGIGFSLYQFIKEKSKNLNVGIDGVVNMQTRYEEAGFKTAYNNTRFSGIVPSVDQKKCIAIQKNDFENVANFDSNFFPAKRQNFLKCWLYQKDCQALMIKETDVIKGYGVIRKCFQGYKIGPLFAEDAETAKLLLSGLASTVSNEQIFLDVPEPNMAGIELAKSYGMQPVFSTVRMYTKTAPSLPLEKIYGVTSFELG